MRADPRALELTLGQVGAVLGTVFAFVGLAACATAGGRVSSAEAAGGPIELDARLAPAARRAHKCVCYCAATRAG